MLKINEVKAGRIYSVVFAGEVKMLKGGRGGVAPNPLADVEVTKRTVIKIQAMTREGYTRRMIRKFGTEWKPSSKPSAFHPHPENPCVDVHNETGVFYLRGTPLGVIKHQVFVGGKPATVEELATVAAYKPAGGKPEDFIRLTLDKIEHEGWEDSTED